MSDPCKYSCNREQAVIEANERLAKLDISEEEMRQEFEKHFGAPVPLARNINGDYVYAEARVAFNNYRAGIKLMQERCK